MDFKDYYEVLGVTPDVDDKTLKTAYRKLARKYHPDVSKEADAEARFKEVAEAYDVLRDPHKRAEYDQVRLYQQQGERFQVPPDWQPGSGDDYSDPHAGFGADYSDFFESLFGAAGRSQQGGFARRGRDVELELPLFLEESQAGSTKPLSFSLPQRDELGRRVGETTKTLNVKIPAGSTDGERIRLKGQGEPGIGGAAAGDLYLVIRLVPHPVFDVDGQDLVVGVPLAPWEAALGAKVQVPTLDGQIMLSIPAGSQSGARLRVRGKGLAGKGGQGDLYALLKVVMPPKGDEETQALWRQLAERAAFDPRQDWRKVR
ncbi:curved DNA-binding protein [Pseudomonas oryzihabitans]|uniref:Curved DNA-binding protein n=1 Tax=Pseudomonas oryzihabitans TaxID=47885 RepID=A0AAJ2BM22_9PSED|nr:curved DNA-binding protein [Pseudomonas psychrotolerans]MDR6235460.1 curved DNA-binding protein [Pseudomonas psychrotolerans]